MLPLPAPLTISLNVRLAFAQGTKLLNADKVRDVNSGGVRKSGILRGFKVIKDVQNHIARGPFGLKRRHVAEMARLPIACTICTISFVALMLFRFLFIFKYFEA
jgi:hypothetical protein